MNCFLAATAVALAWLTTAMLPTASCAASARIASATAGKTPAWAGALTLRRSALKSWLLTKSAPPCGACVASSASAEIRWSHGSKKASDLPELTATLAGALPSDCLELDELWSFVAKRKNKRWVWLAQCRRTRQIVAYAVGDRSEITGRLLSERVPAAYKQGMIYTDFWEAYKLVLPPEQHVATSPRAKATVRPATSSGSTIRSGKGWPVLFVEPCRSAKTMRGTNTASDCFGQLQSITIT